MSMWGFARNATKSYLTNLNASSATRLVTGGWRAGFNSKAARSNSMRIMKNYMSFPSSGYRAGSFTGDDVVSALGKSGRMGFGLRGAAEGIRRWAWTGRTAAERATRIGTAAGAGLLAGNVVNPKNNWGPF